LALASKNIKTAIAAALLFSGFGYLQMAQSQQGTPAPAAPVPAERALVDRYCVGCHSDRLKTGQLSLEKLDLSSPVTHAETWEKVVRKLRTGSMPPQGLPRPDAALLDNFAAYLETSLDRAALAKLNPGRATLHRMNRSEYSNSIRDLLQLDIDVAQLLPPDDESYGFDNNADVLGISPVLLEQYINASAKIARLAVGDPGIGPVASTYKTRADLSQANRMEGMPLGTRGGLVTKHNFPLDGEYVFKIILARNTVDVTRGLEEVHEIEILVDNARVFMTKIGGKEDTDKLTVNPTSLRAEIEARMTARVPVKAGPRQVAVTFVKKNSAQEDYILQPFLRTTLDPVNEAGLPHVENLIVAGPYNAVGPGETPSRNKIFSCKPTQASQEVGCAREILTKLARQAYRRPVTDRDLEPLLSFYQASRNRGGNFDQGIESGIRMILADPQFVFRFETDPANIPDGTAYRVNDLELASRLSYFLWSSLPDEQLIQLASQNKLRDNAVLEQQVRRMLADSRADALVDNFAAQWLFLRNMKNTFPDPQEFPNFDDNLRQDLRKETSLFIGSIFREDHNVLDLLGADYTFVNERVARHYGIPNVYGARFRRVKVTEDARRGLLGHASILSVTSHTTRTSPVLRGKWILSNLLGTPPPPPPPDVPALKENSEGGKPASVRERMVLHRANPTCATCHNIMDPLGFALENFDATGRWRVTDSGEKIDASGVLLDGTKVDSPSALRNALLAKPNVFVTTFTDKLMTYALGRGLDYNDMPALRGVTREAVRNEYKFSSVVLGIVKSVPFQMKLKGAQPVLGAQR
jgi:mono/diheme cytochrome c family protein